MGIEPTVSAPCNQLPETPHPMSSALTTTDCHKLAVLRLGLLFFSRGGGRGHAIPDIAIAKEILRLRPDIDIRFVSYGTGASTFKEFGHSVIDLGLPERNSALETLVPGGDIVRRIRPDLIVSHEEFIVPPIARMFSILVSFITDWFIESREFRMLCLRYADDILFLDDRSVYNEPLYLADKVRYLGPALRKFTYSRADRNSVRDDLALSQRSLVISVFVHPGRRIEKVAPIFELVMTTYDSLDYINKNLIWVAGEDCDFISRIT